MTEPARPPGLQFVLRLDDYSAWPEAVSPAILELIWEHRVPHTVGIIPEAHGSDANAVARPFDSESPMVAPLRALCDEGLVEPALHGWDHGARRLSDGTYSELAGLGADEQARRILAGKARLETALGHPVRTLVPPYNSYDDLTLAACEEAGVTALSASFKAGASNDSVALLPVTCTLMTVERTLNEWGRMSRPPAEPVFLVLMYHAYELRESGDPRACFDLTRLRRLLSTLRASGEVALVTVGQAVERFRAQLTAERFGRARWYWTYLERRQESLRARCASFDAPTPHLYYPSAAYQVLEERLSSRDRSWPTWILSPTGARLGLRWIARRLPGARAATPVGR